MRLLNIISDKQEVFEPKDETLSVVITGSARIGKTTLAAAITKLLQEAGVETITVVSRDEDFSRVRDEMNSLSPIQAEKRLGDVINSHSNGVNVVDIGGRYISDDVRLSRSSE